MRAARSWILLTVASALLPSTAPALAHECPAWRVSVEAEPEWYQRECRPASESTPWAQQAPAGVPAPAGTAYMLNLASGDPNPLSLQSFTLPNATAPTILGPQVRPLYALDFDDSTGTLWGIDNSTRELGRLDTATAAFTAAATVTGVPPGDTISGLAIDPRRGVFYVSATGLGASSLYRLDPATGAATLLGPVTGYPAIVDIAVDCDGVIFGHDLSADVLVEIDPLTGAPTLVGSTGVDANFAQGMDFDNATGTLYAWVRKAAGGTDLMTVNTRTGLATTVSTPPPGQYVGAIPGCCFSAKGNFNRDGWVDIAFRNTASNRMSVWMMDGATRIAGALVTPDPADANWRVVATDDFDDESSPGSGPDKYHGDLLLRNVSTGALEFWLMNGTDRVGPAVPLTLAPACSPLPGLEWELEASGDFDGDENPDLVWRNTQTGDLRIWTLAATTCTGTITPTPSLAPHVNWRVAAALDLDHDGFRDLLWYNSTSGKAVIWLLDGAQVRQDGFFTNPANAGDANWEIVAGGDFGAAATAGAAQCSADILWRNRDSGKLVVWRLDFAGQRQQGLFTTPDAPQVDARRWVPVGPR